MLMLKTAKDLREQVSLWKQQGKTIGFVPTMGNLHAGHLSLVERARNHADIVIVSIFVNPAQFGPNEDFESYPRTLYEDTAALYKQSVDALFTPSIEEMYGDSVETTVTSEPELNSILCGATRPGHFDGVVTIVSKLFEQVKPDIAVFGQKDYQQLVVIRAMVKKSGLPVEILGHETRREADGLAMSSRNSYLSPEERQLAPTIYMALNQLITQVKNNSVMMQEYIEETIKMLDQVGFEVEYVDIRRQKDLKVPERDDKELVALVAVKLGKTRLIDNLLFELE